MLVLRGVAANLVNQRRISAHDVLVHKELQWHDVPWIVVLQPLAAERKCAEILVNNAKQLLGSGVPDRSLV